MSHNLDDKQELSDKKYKGSEEQNIIERMFEKGLWGSRFFVILAVVPSLISSLALFVIASVDIFNIIKYIITTYASGFHPEDFHAKIMGEIIGAVDLYLIAVVMFIFGYGLYELFISYVDVSKDNDHSRVLEIHSLDALKDKITKVIIMVLVVYFFKKVLSMAYQTPLEMMMLAGSIFALSLGLYFLHKHKY